MSVEVGAWEYDPIFSLRADLAMRFERIVPQGRVKAEAQCFKIFSNQIKK